MNQGLLLAVELGTGIFGIAGLAVLLGCSFRIPCFRRTPLTVLTIVGPITLGLCWLVLLESRANETVFWARLMTGDASSMFAVGALGLVAGSGFALAALSLEKRFLQVCLGAFFFACIWIVLLLHPTPHDVPIPRWLDKAVWFFLLVGGAAACVVIFLRFKDRLSIFSIPLGLVAGALSLLSVFVFAAHHQAWQPLALDSLAPEERITNTGCLACHTMHREGRPEPGGGLESVASRTEDVVRNFLQEPDAESAKTLGIRETPTGEMAGVHLTPEQVDAFVDTLKSLFGLKSPVPSEAKSETVAAILSAKTCLACHSLAGEGAPQGGIGGPLEHAAEKDEEVLRAWLTNPTAENATKLKIRETPTGAMAAFKLTEEEASILVPWLRQLKTE
ncbi:MAG: c-type cytochrome [bacterium]